MKDIIFAVTDRKILIRARFALISHHRIRTVHRLGGINIGILLARLDLRFDEIPFFIGFQIRHDKHVVLIMRPVTGNQPQLAIVNQRRRNFRISENLLLFSGEVHERIVQLPSTGQPVWHTGGGLIKHKELQLLPDLTVIPLLCLFNQRHMRLQFLLGRKGIAIDALQLLPVLISSPVRAGHRPNLKSNP